MNKITEGDMVRVEFEGVVEQPLFWGGDDTWGVKDSSGYVRLARPEDVTVIPSPMKVGDKITSVDQLDRLPAASVIVAKGQATAAKDDATNEWFMPGDDLQLDPSKIANAWRATVVYVGRAS